MVEEPQPGSSHAALFFYCAITALHARHWKCPLLEVLVSRINFRAPDSIKRRVRELLLHMGHQAMLSLHTTVGPQPGGVKINNGKIKWQRETEAGTLPDLVLGEINHPEQEFSSCFVNRQTSSHVLSRTRNFITRKNSQ